MRALRARQLRRYEEERDARDIWNLRTNWRDACEYLGLGQSISTVSGGGYKTPRVERVSLRPHPYLMVHLLRGQVPEDIQRVGPRLARALGVAGIRVVPSVDDWVRVDLFTRDPLADVFPLPPAGAGSPVLIGVDETATALELEPIEFPHIAVQGITRSGKSVWTYGLLSQLARSREVLIAGCDPSGLLFRPFAGSKHAELQVSGVSDPEAFAKVLDRLVNEMDHRIRQLQDDRDQVVISDGLPLLFVVFEEIAGLYRVCDQHSRELGKLVRSLIGRLLAEGAKAGIRVVLIVQRAEAAMLGAFERAQCAMRVTFGVDSLESVRLLHPAAELSQCAEHIAAEPGVALLSMPGLPLARFRAPYIGGYAQYCAAVRTTVSGGL